MSARNRHPSVPPARPAARVRRALSLLAVPLLGVLAACGSSGGTAAPSSAASAVTAGFPVTVTGANGSVTLATRPTRIVSLSPTATEMLFALGAGSQVTAVDDQSSYPADAPRTKLSGFQPNVEAVAGYSPDLVVLSNDENGAVAGLTKLKIPVLQLPAAQTLQDSYQQEVTLGEVTGHRADAETLVTRTKARIAAAVASVPHAQTPLRVYHELDPTYYSATSSTFIGSIYRLFGLANIADGAKDTSGGYPQLSAEFVVKQAPDLIVLADSRCCHQDAASLAKRPAFASLPAVKEDRVISVDDDIASRWGPRVADFAEQVAQALGGGS